MNIEIKGDRILATTEKLSSVFPFDTNKTNDLESMITEYTLMGNESALSYDMLKKISYDYLNKVIRGNNLPRWDKGVKEELNELGYIQNKETGQPQRDASIEKAWRMSGEQTRRELDSRTNELSAANYLITVLRKEIDNLKTVGTYSSGTRIRAY
jgi:hypothetical protein